MFNSKSKGSTAIAEMPPARELPDYTRLRGEGSVGGRLFWSLLTEDLREVEDELEELDQPDHELPPSVRRASGMIYIEEINTVQHRSEWDVAFGRQGTMAPQQRRLFRVVPRGTIAAERRSAAMLSWRIQHPERAERRRSPRDAWTINGVMAQLAAPGVAVEVVGGRLVVVGVASDSALSHALRSGWEAMVIGVVTSSRVPCSWCASPATVLVMVAAPACDEHANGIVKQEQPPTDKELAPLIEELIPS